MSSLTSKQIRNLMSEFSPKPGYVLKLTRIEFEDAVEAAIGIDISDEPGSNGTRLKTVLQTSTQEQVNDLVSYLRSLSA